jgi:hypothetical protein
MPNKSQNEINENEVEVVFAELGKAIDRAKYAKYRREQDYRAEWKRKRYHEDPAYKKKLNLERAAQIRKMLSEMSEEERSAYWKKHNTWRKNDPEQLEKFRKADRESKARAARRRKIQKLLGKNAIMLANGKTD